MCAEITFRGGMGMGIYIKRIVRAGLHTGFTSNATFIIKIYDPVRSFEERCGRADMNAGGIITVVTAKNRKMSSGIRKFSFLDIFYPGSIDSEGDLILFLAGNRTSMTTDAFTMVDEETVFHEMMNDE
jgi:hypothetical protein